MDRAGEKASQLSADELKAIFEVVAHGETQENARQRLSERDRNTVNRAYNVVSEFERRKTETCNDTAATEIAKKARYGATPHYVETLFLPWKAWKSPDSAHSDETREANPDPESALHRRELVCFGQRLRDWLTLPSPVDVVKDRPAVPLLWQGEPASEFRSSQSDEEASAAREWGYGSVDATKLPLFSAFKRHLDKHPCWKSLGRVRKTFRLYDEACRRTYRTILGEAKNHLTDILDDDAEKVAMSLLLDGWYRKLGSPGLYFSYEPHEERVDGAIRYQLHFGTWRTRPMDAPERLQALAAAHQEIRKGQASEAQLNALAQAYTTAKRAMVKFQKDLSPDALLRKLVLSGHCDLCP